MRDRIPIRVRLADGEVAVREVGQRDFEPELARGAAAAVVAVTGGAGGRVDGARLGCLCERGG